jgi:hypothetical protein
MKEREGIEILTKTWRNFITAGKRVLDNRKYKYLAA